MTEDVPDDEEGVAAPATSSRLSLDRRALAGVPVRIADWAVIVGAAYADEEVVVEDAGAREALNPFTLLSNPIPNQFLLFFFFQLPFLFSFLQQFEGDSLDNKDDLACQCYCDCYDSEKPNEVENNEEER